MSDLEKIFKKLNKTLERQGNLLQTIDSKLSMLTHMDVVIERMLLGMLADANAEAADQMMYSAQQLNEKINLPENAEKQDEIRTTIKRMVQDSTLFRFIYSNAVEALKAADKKVMPYLQARYPVLGRSPEEAMASALKCVVCGKPTSMVANGKPACKEHYKELMEEVQKPADLEKMKQERLKKLREEESNIGTLNSLEKAKEEFRRRMGMDVEDMKEETVLISKCKWKVNHFQLPPEEILDRFGGKEMYINSFKWFPDGFKNEDYQDYGLCVGCDKVGWMSGGSAQCAICDGIIVLEGDPLFDTIDAEVHDG